MPSSPPAVSAISKCAENLQQEVDMMSKRLKMLETNVQLKNTEKHALKEQITRLQAQNDEDDTDITSTLFDREKSRVERSPTRHSSGSALASYEATDEIQRKEKLIELEKLFITGLEKRQQSLHVEIVSVDADIEGAEHELTEVLEKTGHSIASRKAIMEKMESNESLEAFFKKGEELYQSDMRHLADLKNQIEKQQIDQKALQMLLKSKADVVQRLLEEKQQGNTLKENIASTENDIRVTDRSIREQMQVQADLSERRKTTDAELEATDAHSKYLHARFSLKEDTDFLHEQYHSQNALIHDLRTAKKSQMAHTLTLERSIAVLERAAKCLGVAGGNFHVEVKASTDPLPLATDIAKIADAYHASESTHRENIFTVPEEENTTLKENYIGIIDCAHQALEKKSAAKVEKIEAKFRQLEELQDTIEVTMQTKQIEEREQLEETIHTARHTDDLKHQLGAQQQQMFEELKGPMQRRLHMQRRLSENTHPSFTWK